MIENLVRHERVSFTLLQEYRHPGDWLEKFLVEKRMGDPILLMALISSIVSKSQIEGYASLITIILSWRLF